MPGRYRDEDYQRRDRREDFGYRGGGYRDRDFDDRDYGSRRFGPSFGDRAGFDRDEGYFGGSRQGYGEGYGGFEPNRTFGSSWRDSTGQSAYDYPERRYESFRRRGGFGRDAYGLGYGSDRVYGERPSRERSGESHAPNRHEKGYA